jgi:hypothetical protein
MNSSLNIFTCYGEKKKNYKEISHDWSGDDVANMMVLDQGGGPPATFLGTF